ncbi:disease resistance protein RGA2-like [Chenopodium quinoa]|uniref:disease resistance protein RGA2-like n=1 Tax=Chenopodium quinoa TaxID=63459 RepID=UPI000B76D76D|nr:disease resistance protein RGA2-like [Chenopodium quinoa]
MSSRVTEIKKQLDETVDNHRKFKFKVDNNPIVRRKEETYSYVVAEDIIGRDDDKKVVVDMSLGPNDVHEHFRVVTIVGVGGLGKTALAQLVYNDKRVEEEFPDPNLRLWVCVSDQDGEQFDVKAILCKIVEVVQKLSDTASLEWVRKRIQEILGGKKYLLILDDVWNEDRDKWLNLQSFLMIGEGGSRIVVTTRSVETGEITGDKNIYKLEGLSQENSWHLFETVAFNKGQEHENHLELVEIGKKIVKKCCNIPLALKVVGSLLFGQHMNKWHSFKRSGLSEIKNGENKIMSILKLSYHNLRPSLKNCFSYCAAFPKDFEIERQELISLWMAQGYIESLDGGCFFQDVKKDEYGAILPVKIHDLMHDVAQEVGRKELSVVSSNTSELGNKIRHVYNVSDNCPQSSLLKKSKIRSFILSRPRHRTLAESIQMDRWVCLRVLSLKSANIKTYPDSIGKLLHLRYLNLSRNHILAALPDSIIELHNLQTLLLSDCNNLRELPKGFSKLVKLRHLDLSRCRELTVMPSGIGKLTSLRHLGLEECYKLTCMTLGMDKLTHLRVLPFFVVGKGQRVSSEEQYSAELKDLKALANLIGGIHIKIGKYYIEGLNNGEDEYLKSMKHIVEVNIGFDFDIDAYKDPDFGSYCQSWQQEEIEKV